MEAGMASEENCFRGEGTSLREWFASSSEMCRTIPAVGIQGNRM